MLGSGSAAGVAAASGSAGRLARHGGRRALTSRKAKAPGPSRARASSAAAQNSGYSKPPFGLANIQPFGKWTSVAPSRSGICSTATIRA